jgi:hypothetical protein
VSISKKTWNSHIALLAAYWLLALTLTWPTAGHFSAHVPGDGIDDPAIVWNLWWVKYSLLNAPQTPFFSDFIFYPLGINLAFYTLTTLNGLTSLPLLLNAGPVAASNLHLWFSLAIGGYGAFLLVYYFLLAPPWGFSLPRNAAWWGAVLAGLVYAFSSSRLFYVALGQFNIASSHWIPFVVLFYLKMHRNPRKLRWAALAALFLTMQAWAELTYASFLIIFMGLHWLYWLLTDLGRRGIRSPYLRAIVVLVILFALGISPILAALLPDMRAEGDLAPVGRDFADIFSGDLLGFFVPTMHHPLFGDLISKTGIVDFDKGQQIYIGYGLFVLAGLGFFRHRRDPEARFWLFAGLVFGLLILGPQIRVNGQQTGLAGLFNIVQQVPIFNLNRYPSRYSSMLLLSLAPPAALGFGYLAEKVRLRTDILALGLAALIMFENLSLPLPQSNMTIPQPYQTIAADAEEFTVLDIPFGWRNGFRVTGAHTVGIMFGQFYQTLHQKPLLGGNTSRNPELKFQYFTEAPVISSLKLLETGYRLPPETWEADRPLAAEALRFFNIRYIVVRPEAPGDLNHPQATIPYIEQLFPVEEIYQDESLSLYRVDLPPLPDRVDVLASPLRRLYFAEGWGLNRETIAAQRKTVRLLVPLNGAQQAFTFGTTNRLENTMRLSLNGWLSEPLSLPGTGAITIPAEAVRPGLNEFYLHFDHLSPARTLGPDLTVISAGEEGGNLGHIYLNGVGVSPNRRGYNIALITPDGALLEAANFDTHSDPAASQALADFIAAAPEEALIAVAVADTAVDNGSNHLTEEAIVALRSIGCRVDLRGQLRASHACIGGKAAAAPLEVSDPLQHPVSLTTNLGLTEPGVAAVFESLRFEAVEP